jgi:CubicO group peptidase (beta-lactamase class C family)
MTEPLVNDVLKWRGTRRGLIEASLGASTAAVMAPIVGGRAAAMPAGIATPIAGADLDAAFAKFDDLIVERMAELKIPGVAVGVIVGEREHAKGFGVTNVDHPLPVATDTLFQIGSTTKTYTGTAIMRLIEQGKLELEAPVRIYLPDFRVADPVVSREVRLRHLVTHTAGWYDRSFQETGDGDDALACFVAGMADLPQVTPLGKYFSYSNSAVCLAGRVIEAVTGQTYEAAVRELVLRPLGLQRASFFAEEIMTEAFAVGHGAPSDDPQGAPVVLTPWALPRSVNPAGGLIASVDDELRYARFHLGDGSANGTRLLSAESLRRMQTPLGPGGSTPFLVVDRVGVNWMLQWRDGAQIVSHLGGSTGQLSDFTLVPERDFAVMVLSNANAGAVLVVEATDWALERFLGLPRPAMTPISLSPAQRAAYTGGYILPANGGTIQIREDYGALRLELFASSQTAPDIASPLRFIGDDLALHDYMGVPVYTDFVRDGAGKVVWIRFLGRMVPRG